MRLSMYQAAMLHTSQRPNTIWIFWLARQQLRGLGPYAHEVDGTRVSPDDSLSLSESAVHTHATTPS